MLQRTLLDLIDLSLVGKQSYWTVIGARSTALRHVLDDIVVTARRHADAVAERSAALGIPPDGRAAAVAARSDIPQWAPGWERDDDVIDHLAEAYRRLTSA
ncbi:DNA starvation/stationary phase protection protein, partial [Micromonospora chalcea]